MNQAEISNILMVKPVLSSRLSIPTFCMNSVSKYLNGRLIERELTYEMLMW